MMGAPPQSDRRTETVLYRALSRMPHMSRHAQARATPEPIRIAHAGQRPLHVCFISPLGETLYRPSSGRPFGGAEVQFYLSATALARDPSYGVTVLVTVGQDPSVEQHQGLTVVRRLGTAGGRPTRTVVGRWSAALGSFLRMLSQLRRIDADVFLHAGAGIEVGAYALICRLLRRKFVFVVASTADLSRPVAAVGGPLQWLYPLGVRLAHAVICRTEDQREALRVQYGRVGTLIRTAYPVPAAQEGARTVILWVGRIHPVKQPHVFLDLAEQIPDIPCVMVGMRDALHPALWDGVRGRAAALPHVSFHDNLSLDQVDRWFQSAALLVNTSIYEGFPNTFVQAAVNGVPIVSWTVNPDEVLSRHRIGFCAGGTFNNLVTSVRRVHTEKGLWDDCRRRARAYGVAQHDLDQSITALKQLLHALTGSKAVPGSQMATS